MKLISGTSNINFARKIAKHLDRDLLDVEIGKFPDGEIKIIINENIRRKDCFIIQSTASSLNNSPNDNFMELVILIDALKRGSANSVNIVMPYYGYERQDRKDYSRAPISARVIATILESLKVDRIITFDLHAGQIQGFFSCHTPFDNLYVEKYFIDHIKINIIKESPDDVIIVSPDEGGAKRAIRIANKLGLCSTIIYKERNKDNSINKMCIMGHIKQKIAILVDDMIDTAGTACKAAEILKENGVEAIYMYACHGLFSGQAIERIENSSFNKVIVTNTIEQTKNKEHIKKYNCNKIEVIDVSKMCAEAIRRSLYGESLKELYDTPIDDNLYR